MDARPLEGMELGFDMDGVIAQIQPWWIYLINRYYGENLTEADITDWSIHKFCKNATAKQVYGLLEQPGFFRHLEPIPDACPTIDALIEAGAKVSIITTTTHGQRDKIEWLEAHIQNFTELDIYTLTRGKHRVRCDVFVDDYHKNLIDYNKHNPDALLLCFNQPYNRGHDVPAFRVDNWIEIENIIYAEKGIVPCPRSLNPPQPKP